MVVLYARERNGIDVLYCDTVEPRGLLSVSKRSSKPIFDLRTIAFRKELVSIELAFQKKKGTGVFFFD